ncbi:MAG: hypothetical protein RLZZ612_1526 [Pseudomonadota bacterium]|jgi:uncharacterized membrane protein
MSSESPLVSEPSVSSHLQPRDHALINLTRTVAVSSLLGLIVLGLVWELWLAPLRPGGSWVALKVLPLCIPLAGLLKRRMYTYRWLSLLVWLYFTEGVVRAWSDRPPSQWLAMLEVVLCLVLFAVCAAHVRLRLTWAKRGPHLG